MKIEPILLIIITIFLYFFTPHLKTMQRGFNHWMMRESLSHRFKTPIWIVYLDEKDIATLGGWPLKRNIYGFLVDRLVNLGVRTIGFHVYWPESSIQNDENDHFLASMLQKYHQIVGSYYFDELNAYNEDEPTIELLEWFLDFHESVYIQARGLHPPDSIYLQTHTKYGFSNLLPSQDGMIEETPLFVQCGQSFYPSFSYIIGNTFKESIKTNYLAQVRIQYHMTTNELPIIPVHKIIRPDDKEQLKKQLEGCIVLVGIISSQLGFEKPTPVDPAMPVIGIHAHIIDNLVQGEFFRAFPSWSLFPFSFLFILSFWMVCIQQLRIKVIGSLAFSIILLVVTFLLWKLHFIFPLYLFLILIFCYILIGLGQELIRQKKRYFEEMKRRQKLELEFADKVESVARLEKEFYNLRDRYHREIDDIREELSEVSQDEAHKIMEAYPEVVCSPNSPMIKILSELARIGETDEPVFIMGESGTGKELIAKLIHQCSKRSDYRFLAMNCGAISESLLESEIFGHEKGAFTGAQKEKVGFFEAADRGTIFLDEISETSLSFQAKLLRVLQEGTFFRVGSTRARSVDVRVIAATNRNIEEMIEGGKFRQDLYFRLNVLPVHLPPLKERRDDILILLSHFLGDKPLKISTGAKRVLMSYHWPGNVRELQNITIRMRLLEDHILVSTEWVQNQLSVDKTELSDSEEFDQRILLHFRDLDFSNDANKKIAEIMGHLHRSTITEYLKGMTFQFFYEENYRLDQAVKRFNPTPHPNVDTKIRKRMIMYLKNLTGKLDSNLTLDENIKQFRNKIKKLPKKYHHSAIELAKSFLMNVWRI